MLSKEEKILAPATTVNKLSYSYTNHNQSYQNIRGQAGEELVYLKGFHFARLGL